MTDTRDTLMRAILVDPADDTARLVYADWQEENGGSVPCPTCNGTGHELWSCKVCGAEPRDDGEVQHGRGCYRLSSDGGGSEYPDLNPCPECSGARAVSNGLAERAEFIRLQIAGIRRGQHELFTKIRPQFGYAIANVWNNDAPDDAVTPLMIVRRGFVSAVRTTLAHWTGGPCERCRGQGFLGHPAPGQHGFIGTPKCPLCKGVARTPAHGPRIVAEQPVESAQLSDRRPFSNLKVDGGMEYGFEQHDGGGATGTGMLPTSIFDLLEGHYRQPNKFRKWWLTESAAQSALSLALLNWARREAGLPPLEERT